MEFTPIAHIRSDFPTKFGIPRQSGLVESLEAQVVFLPEYRRSESLRGLDSFSHIWLVWVFHLSEREGWSPTVRPPRLGGNRRLGVFATRSPFRPNPIGLSAVALAGIEHTRQWGDILHVRGADLADGTPILDVKPYLPYADCIPQAEGFAPETNRLQVVIPPEVKIPPDLLNPLKSVLAQDPRPRYQDDPHRVYGFPFGGLEIRFSVDGDCLTVHSANPLMQNRDA